MTTAPPIPAAEVASAAEWLGAVGSALGALGTFAAVAFSLWLARRDGERLKVERREAAQDRLEASEERRWYREQHEREVASERQRAAKRVSLSTSFGPRWEADGTHMLVVDFAVKNGGEEPIRAVNVVAREVVDPPSRVTTVPMSKKIIEGQSHRVGKHERPLGTYWMYEVQFTDGEGVRWVVDEFARLDELDPASDRAVKGPVPW